ncbi:polcalcin Phl p [Trifolium repens]|nr:polcalcin Phl p [Trifolium repens]
MAFIVRNVSSDGKRVMTLQQFKQWLKTSFDTNSDGRISKGELREALRITGGLFASWKSNKVLKSVDSNHDGFIDDKEFVNLARNFPGSTFGIELYNAPSLHTFAFTGEEYFHKLYGSKSVLSSIKHVYIDVVCYWNLRRTDPSNLLDLLVELANIESLTITSTTLMVLSNFPDILKVKLPSLLNLKSLKIITHPRARPTTIPNGMVDFLRQNSPLAKVLIVAALLGIRNVSSDAKRVMTLQQFKQWLKTSFGTNSDGRISKSELREALRITDSAYIIINPIISPIILVLNCNLNFPGSTFGIELYNAPSLHTFAFTGEHYFHKLYGSKSVLSSIKLVYFDVVCYWNLRRTNPSNLLDLLVELANIESLTITSTTLMVLSNFPDILKVKLPSLLNLKSLKIITHPRARPTTIPNGMVDFLRQNSPLAKVDYIKYK